MNRNAGMLRERVLCQRKAEALDGLGNPVPGGSDWKTQFETRAGFIPKNGGEAVLAGRLAGRQTYIALLRSSERSRSITPEWRIVDARAGFKADGKTPVRSFNVRSLADPDGRRQWLELLVEEGVAT